MDSNHDPNNVVHRHQSRLKREMYANRINPFNSPPSSTGSHGTVSTTTGDLTQDLSNFSFNPDDEGTRRLSGDINSLPKQPTAGRTARFGTRPTTIINTSALARAFPEWSSIGSLTKDINFNPPTRPLNRPIARPVSKIAKKPATVIDEETKENIPPPSEDTVPVEKILDTKPKRTRAEMQPRVETASNSSTILSRTPTKPIKPSTRRSRFAKAAAPQSPGSPDLDPRPSIQNLVSKLRAAQAPKEKEPEHPRVSMQPDQQKSASNSPVGLTGRSFLIPSFHHIPDWTSGTLKFSALRNGVPVFVKHGKARTQFEQSANQHDTVEAVDVPEEDQEIFVSMDKIREEVRELQEHDEMVQREAEELQLEVNRLQTELKRFKQRKRSDSAFGSGSDSEHSINKALDAQRNLYDEKIAQLQSRLEQASRQVGVNDIHSAALTAERDEALHQASQARERAKRLQAELESSQKDLESTMRYRHEKETLELENTSLRDSNDTIRQQHDSVVANHKSLTNLHNKLRRDYESVQRELASVREELQDLRSMYESLREEKMMLAQDHASMERSNDTYFKENKSLRSKIEAGERRISDLEKGISRRDQLINEMQANMTQNTEPAGIREEYAELENQVKRLKQQYSELERQHFADKKERDELIQAKDERIMSLMRDVSDLQAQLSGSLVLQRENMDLREELNELRQQETLWHRDHNKNVRLTRNENILVEDLQQRTRNEAQWAQEKASLQHKIDRQSAAIKTMRQAAKEINNLTLTNTTAKITKLTRIIEPSQPSKEKYAGSEYSDKSEALHVDDDPTRQLDMTEQSDFLSVLTDDPVLELKEAIGQLQLRQQHVNENSEEASAGNTVQTIDSLPSLPGPVMRRSKSDDTITQKQKQPPGILKRSRQFTQDDNLTGGHSVRSGHSAASRNSRGADGTIQSQFSVKSYHSAQAEDNMTSAFIIPDITIQSTRRISTAGQPAGPALSKQARSVLDGICDHKAHNCSVCSRITTQTRKHGVTTETDEGSPKKRVRVQKPIPVSDRMPRVTGDYEEEPTLRPSMPPGNALAIVLKELQDEAQHLEMLMTAKQQELFSLDKSVGKRERSRVRKELQKLSQDYESKSAQVYKLHDVLEGQKQAGQLMTQEEVEVTIASICGVETTLTQESRAAEATRDSKASEWNGFD